MIQPQLSVIALRITLQDGARICKNYVIFDILHQRKYVQRKRQWEAAMQMAKD